MPAIRGGTFGAIRRAMLRTLGPLSLLALALVGCGDVLDQKSCTAIGCNSQVSTTLDLTNVGDAAGAKVVVCRNSACVEGTVNQQNGQLSCSFQRDGSFLGPSCNQAFSGNALSFTYTLADGEAKDGDTYSFKVTGKTGGTASKEGAVTYQVSRPNGPDCEPVCSQATLS